MTFETEQKKVPSTAAPGLDCELEFPSSDHVMDKSGGS